ncbi:MAG: hypothetical protein JM58_04795 [Peptococcaceae bacterium BICA1-8]|nr:MAG: hypothetical protein JM58_04795 [Peptococcaceae bacterium BICA1-8]
MVNTLREVPLEILKKNKITGIILDLDNTLTDWNCVNISKDVCEWIVTLKNQGFKICIVSNNGVERIEASLKNLDVPYVPNALKPGKRAFLKAMKLLGTTSYSTAIIGDQLFTDILGGKRLRLTTILVKPRSKKEFIGTQLVRKIEKVILSRF